MLEIQKEAIGSMWDCPELRSISDSILDMGVNRISRYSYFDTDHGRHDDGNGFKVEEKDAERLVQVFGKCVEGVKDIDNMIQELKYMRGNIIESALRLRHAYRPAKFRSEVMRLHQLSENWKENQKSRKKEVAGLMAKILGFEKMPEDAIDFNLFNDTSHDSVVVNFSIKGKPTSVAVSLPVEVDYRRRHSIPDDDDKYQLFYTDSLVEKTPQIVLYVFLGAVAESGEFGVDTTDCIHAVCPDLKTLSEKVKLAIGVDVRDKMKKVTSITDVKTVEDFCYWRGLRAANASASLHKNEEKEERDV